MIRQALIAEPQAAARRRLNIAPATSYNAILAAVRDGGAALAHSLRAL